MAAIKSGMPREKRGNATSLYDLMRNIAASFGIATMTPFLACRGRVHQNQMIGHVTPCNHSARNRTAPNRKTSDLRPAVKKSQVRKRVALGQGPVPEPEMAGAIH